VRAWLITGVLVAVACAALPAWAPAQNGTADQLAILSQRVQRESNPVDRAKAFPKYGDALISEYRRSVTSGDTERALNLMQQYRDTVKAIFAGLKATGVNADKKPAGFKNLQIHLRQGLTQMKSVNLSVPVTERDPFEAIRKELEGADSELIDMLFPRQPGKRPPEQRPK